MPLYDYKCQQHGIFHALATVEDAGLPAPCPQCDQPGARIIMIAPELLLMDSAKRDAAARNEKAMHEPVFSTPDYREEKAKREAHAHKHGKGCGCGDKKRGAKAVYLPDGSKIFPSARPWMISH